MLRVSVNTELCSCHCNPLHLFKAIRGQLIYVCCILILLVQKFSQRESASRIELCCKDLIAISSQLFKQKKWFTRKLCQTLTCKYCKNSKNDKYNKIVDLQRGKAKKALSNSTNFAKIAKVTRLFFLAIKKDRVTNVARIARMTNSAKF